VLDLLRDLGVNFRALETKTDEDLADPGGMKVPLANEVIKRKV
jgi:hypothetical protein